MTEATEHALEQAERIVQYAKYSDRFMVVEGDSAAERRAFVKLIGQKLPRQVRPVVLRADSGNGSAALIDQLSTLLQLSAGIETIDQLINAATAALEGQERLLIVVENADHWLASSAADALFDLITQSHELARERILFLLVGAAGLCEQAETAQPLAGLVADLHCAQLLGTTQAAAAAPTAAAGTANSNADTTTSAAAATTPPSAPSAGNPSPRPASASRPLWASPTLLIAAVISLAVVAIGVFALLGRSDDPTQSTTESTIALDESSEQSDESTSSDTANTEEQAANEETDSEAPSAAEAPTEEGANSETETAALPDHGLPPHVPFPEERADEGSASATAEASDETAADRNAAESTDGGQTSNAEVAEQEADAATAPVTEDAQGTAASTPPADVDNAWFRDQPRARAAIQLAAFGNLDGAEAMIDRFVTDEQPRDQWRIYTQSINGKLLYTVTFGDFASAERAEHAIDSLPNALRELEPYPRSVGAIQDRLVDAAD
ncbi:SPOR domain-containing protein [Guyparkeria sp. TX1]|uniref:SPOR domain-containing protein n=1 Tax=Guyparkeria sp. TX1 TaxID=3115001 RepID=UPI00397744E6